MSQTSIQSCDTFLRLLLFSTSCTPSPSEADTRVLRMLSDRAHEYVNCIVRGGVEAGGRVEGVGEEKRLLLTLEGLLKTIAHDPVAYSRAKDILESKKELNEVLGGFVIKEEEEVEEESDED
ncbi:hypothetical protein TrLO_g2470 [Triparma laevis f. longispina]|uniref:Uncharacterized protein n=1 Tax=Triparma laevis f. longispina TaxID=1714387 RepID=A0A9W7FKK6_9STRA|nr:hypothetical protein TrLO_g2470 [Triparma laevis f. longispina]